MTLVYVCPVIGRVENNAAVAKRLSQGEAVVVASHRDADRLRLCGVEAAQVIDEFLVAQPAKPNLSQGAPADVPADPPVTQRIGRDPHATERGWHGKIRQVAIA